MSATRRAASLFIALAVTMLSFAGGCKTLPEEVRGRIREANSNYEAGNLAAALEAYQSAIEPVRELEDESRALVEVRIGRCQVGLGQPAEAIATFEAIDREVKKDAFLLDDALKYDKYMGHAEAYCETGRRAEPIFLENSGTRAKQLQERREAAASQYTKARALFEQARALRANDLDATLGVVYSFLRYGILTESESALLQANDVLRKCQTADAGDDPRVPYFRGRIVQVLNSKGKLTNAVLDEFNAGAELDVQKRNHDYHEMYRDLFLEVQAFDNERKVMQLEEAQQKRTQEVLAILNNYLQYGREPRAAWTQWVEFRARLKNHFETYNKWSRKKRERDELIQAAKTLVYGSSEAQEVLNYRQAMDLLRKVDVEFWGEEDYVGVRTVAQQQYIKLLVASADALGRIKKWDLALNKIAEARELCVKQFAPEHATLLEQCTKSASKFKADLEWAALQSKVRAKAILDQNEALNYLDENLNSELLAQIEPAETQRFRDDIMDVDRIQLDALLAEADSLEENPTSQEKKLELAQQFVTDKKLDDRRDVVSRRLAKCYLVLDQPQRCIDLVDALKEPGDEDKMLKGHAYATKEDYSQAHKIFRTVNDEVIRKAPPSFVRAAGMAAHRAGAPSEARPLLEEAIRIADERQEDAAATKVLLLECDRKLLEAGKLSARDELEIRNQIAELDKADSANQRRLAVLHYEEAKASKDPNAEGFYLSHRLFKELLSGRSAMVLSEEERKLYWRLTAKFEDYAPLRKGLRLEYNVINGPATTYDVVDGSGEVFDVNLLVDGIAEPSKQEWQKLPASRVLEIRYTGSRDRIPIGLLNPEEPVGGRAVVDAFGKRRYEARVVEIGLTLETGGRTYENCIKVEIREQGQSSHRDFYFAPGVGQVKYADTEGEVWELQRSSDFDAT